jgi:predicted enzyme related to lactoylglutathione lyase
MVARMPDRAPFISGLILLSANAEQLANFYISAVGLPLQREQHDKTHWGCELGDIHFAIHQTEVERSGAAKAFKFALTTWSMEKSIERLRRHNVYLIDPPVDRGFARMAAFEDPDGNIVELTELSNSWLEYLGERREKGHDIIMQWKEDN